MEQGSEEKGYKGLINIMENKAAGILITRKQDFDLPTRAKQRHEALMLSRFVLECLGSIDRRRKRENVWRIVRRWTQAFGQLGTRTILPNPGGLLTKHALEYPEKNGGSGGDLYLAF